MEERGAPPRPPIRFGPAEELSGGRRPDAPGSRRRRWTLSAVALLLVVAVVAIVLVRSQDSEPPVPVLVVQATGSPDDVTISGPEETGSAAPAEARVRLVLRNAGTGAAEVATARLVGPGVDAVVIITAPDAPFAGTDLGPGATQPLALGSRLRCSSGGAAAGSYGVRLLTRTAGGTPQLQTVALPAAVASHLSTAIDAVCARDAAVRDVRSTLVDVAVDPAVAQMVETWQLQNPATLPLEVRAGAPGWLSGGDPAAAPTRTWVAGTLVRSPTRSLVLPAGATATVRVVLEVVGCYELRRSTWSQPNFVVTPLLGAAPGSGAAPGAALELPPAPVTPETYATAVAGVCPGDGVAVVGQRGTVSYDPAPRRVELRFPVLLPPGWQGAGAAVTPAGPGSTGVSDVRAAAGPVVGGTVTVTLSYAVDACSSAGSPPPLSLSRVGGRPAPLLIDARDVPGLLEDATARCRAGGGDEPAGMAGP